MSDEISPEFQSWMREVLSTRERCPECGKLIQDPKAVDVGSDGRMYVCTPCYRRNHTNGTSRPTRGSGNGS